MPGHFPLRHFAQRHWAEKHWRGRYSAVLAEFVASSWKAVARAGGGVAAAAVGGRTAEKQQVSGAAEAVAGNGTADYIVE